MSQKDYTLEDLAEAEIVPNMSGPNAYLVDFGNENYDLVPKTAKHTLILKDGLSVSDKALLGYYQVEFDLGNDDIYINDNDDRVRVPAEKHEHVLWAVHDNDDERVGDIFEEYNVPTVREGLMDMLMPRFRYRDGGGVKKTKDGWMLDGNILVSWDASNHPVDVGQTHIVSGNMTVEADEDKEARDITFDLSDDREVTLPNGTSTELTEVEMKFLTTVGVILGWTDVSDDLYDDGLSHSIRNSRITAFTDEKSGLHHNHGIDKHTLADLGVTDEASSRLWYNDYDHAGVHELYLRRDEFMDAPIDVFDDAENDDAGKWQKIKNTSKKAPIPKKVRSDLESRYE